VSATGKTSLESGRRDMNDELTTDVNFAGRLGSALLSLFHMTAAVSFHPQEHPPLQRRWNRLGRRSVFKLMQAMGGAKLGAGWHCPWRDLELTSKHARVRFNSCATPLLSQGMTIDQSTCMNVSCEAKGLSTMLKSRRLRTSWRVQGFELVSSRCGKAERISTH